jgi:hypothetical protein
MTSTQFSARAVFRLTALIAAVSLAFIYGAHKVHDRFELSELAPTTIPETNQLAPEAAGDTIRWSSRPDQTLTPDAEASRVFQASHRQDDAVLGQPPKHKDSPPGTLNEFRRMAVEEPTHDADGPPVRPEQDQQFTEALLHRALEALRSEHRNLHAEAIDELGSLQDPRAAHALMEAVTKSAGGDASYRFNAVAALAKYVETARSSDAVAVSFLKMLASDNDSDVRSIAAEVINQIERPPHRVAQPAPEPEMPNANEAEGVK